MEALPTDPQKPKRLYFETYLQLVRNAVGSEMFRNFYILDADGHRRDALDDGSNSCAFFLSAVLTLFKKHSGVHGTVESTLDDLERHSWQPVEQAAKQAGDVVLWEAVEIDGEWFEHIGFYIGDDRAVSTSWTEKMVVEHDVLFDGARAIKQVFHQPNWD